MTWDKQLVDFLSTLTEKFGGLMDRMMGVNNIYK